MTARTVLVALALTVVACGACEPQIAPPPAHAWTAVPLSVPPPSASVPVQLPGPPPPVARRVPAATTIHGVVRSDDYAWLRKKDSPEVLDYLRAENAYTDAMMKRTENLQEALYGEMFGRIQEADRSVEIPRGGWIFYGRTEPGKQYAIYCRKKNSANASEEVVLDLNEVGKTSKFVGLDSFELSDDGNVLAYALDTTGFRQFRLGFKDLRTGVALAEHIERVNAVAFARDNRTVLYVVEDPVTKRAYRLHRHTLGTDPASDPLVYEEKDAKFDLTAERSRSGEYIIVTSQSRTTTEVRVIAAGQPTAQPKLIAAREQDHEYYVDHRAGQFLIRTNSQGRNFRIVSAPIDDPRRERWKELYVHDPNVILEQLMAFSDFFVVQERADGLPRLRVVEIPSGITHTIAMPEALYELELDESPWSGLSPGPVHLNGDFKARTIRVRYDSLVTPRSIVQVDLAGHDRNVLKRIEVRGYDPSLYETERLQARAADGTLVPISLMRKKGMLPDRNHPLLLNGYGSYGYPNPVSFRQERLSLVDRGFVFAIAHVRGGGELGKKWHDAGRMATKMNTFTDFIACAEHLIYLGWAARDRMVIEGTSAGGLLMGAVTNLRPDLWRAVVANVPFVDVLNTMLDDSLPLTVPEYEEWGNPKNKADYDRMAQYSPYDNLSARAYPSMLVRTSYNDSQVMYWEPAKYVARIRALKTDSHPLLLKTNLDPAGHGGQSGRYNRLRETAFVYAFILDQVGITR